MSYGLNAPSVGNDLWCVRELPILERDCEPLVRMLFFLAVGWCIGTMAYGQARASLKQISPSFVVSFKWSQMGLDVEVQSPEKEPGANANSVRRAVLNEARRVIPSLSEFKGMERAFGTMICRVEAHNDAAQVTCLLELARVYDPDQQTPLMLAVRNNDYEALQQALLAGENVNETDQSGTSLLMHAVIKGNLRIVKELLVAGADPNLRTRRGWTALLLAAATHDRRTILSELIRSHANLEAKEEDGRTALFIAASHNMVDVIQVLIAAGAEPNTKAKDGKTPLMIAAANNHVEALKSLLAAGANSKALDKDGLDALGIARGTGNQEIIRLLQAAE